MAQWLLLLTLIVVLLAALHFFGRKTTEPFNSLAAQMNFARGQDTYFHEQADKAILTNPGLNLTGLQQAVSVPDVDLPVVKDRDFSVYFMEDPENAFTDRDRQFCRGARMPRDLPARDIRAGVGCGWYFYSDPNRPSVGTLGTKGGPVFKNEFTGGEWIWDLNIAQMKEDIKNCKRVRDCAFLDMEGFKGQCGFCKELGYAVPIRPDGSPKYPDVAEALCGGKTYSTTAECTAPPKVITESGVDCKGLGYPSDDNSIRLYTEGECSKMGGRYIPNGECLKSGGGSFSWDCRGLNTPAAPKQDICAPNYLGRLTRPCLIEIAKTAGFSESGNIIRLLQNSSAPNDMDTMAIDTLKVLGVDIPDSIIGSGGIDKTSALNLYRRIANMMRDAPTDMARKAATYLAVGGIEFDACILENNATGPFSTVCLQRAFRTAGCQPAGQKYPNRQTVSEVANMTWSQVNTMFRKTYDAMKSTDPGEQDTAIKNCLGSGAEFARKTGGGCWKCIPGIPVPLRLNANNDIECASTDGRNCMWSSDAGCKQLLQNMPANIRPLECGDMHRRIYGGSGYDNPIHWCARGKNAKEFGGSGDYEYVGCFGDSGARAIPQYVGNVGNVQQCKERAERMGMNTFGLQYYGECWVGNNPPYAKYGQRYGCGTLGVDWANNVYTKQ